MKKFNINKLLRYTGIFALLVSFALTFTSCSVSTHNNSRNHRSGKVPPGHAKKHYGDKSAKRYAPGQQKKKYEKTKKVHSKKNNHKKRGR